jgi:uncharacterized membrane protein
MVDTAQAPLPPVTPPGAPRWMKILLALSLAANLAIAGIVGGALLHGARDRAAPEVRDIGFGPFTEALSPEDRRELRRAFMADGDNPREMRRQMRADFGRLLDILRTDPFDETALRTALDQFQLRSQERVDLGARLLQARINAMSPAERAAFADRLEQMLARGPRRGDPPPDGG